MNWYLAKMVYQVISGNGNHAPQFDTQFRLIRADELNWAWEKATTVGRLGETIFRNDRSEDVVWKFIAVEDVCLIESLEDGAQVYGSTTEPEDETSFIQRTREKSRLMKACSETHELVF